VWAKLLINGVRIVKKQGLTPQMQKVRQRRAKIRRWRFGLIVSRIPGLSSLPSLRHRRMRMGLRLHERVDDVRIN
jgi:hypothetical protein